MRARLVTSLSVALGLACGAGPEPGSGGSSSTSPADDPESVVTMTEVTVGDLVFDARVAGPEGGALVVLLHGFPETSYEWRHQLRALADAGYRALAPDQRGYSPGARPEGVEAYALSLLVGDVLGIVDAIGDRRFHVVGHDWGAVVAWAVAVAAPDRVITVNPVSVPHPDAFARVLRDPTSCQVEASAYFDLFVQPDYEDVLLADDRAPLRAVYGGLDPDAVDEYVRRLGSKAALGAALNWYRANVADRDITAPPLGPVTVPTMFTWSDGDTALCRDGAVLTEDYVDGPYRFEVLEGVGHWVPEEAPHRMSSLLLDHLGESGS